MFNGARMITKSTLWSALTQAFRDPGESHSLIWAFMVNGLAAGFLVPARMRTIFLRGLGLGISSRALIKPRVIIRCRNLTVGPKTTVNYGCVFDNRGGVNLGSNVGIGVGVRFLTTDHDSSDPLRRAGAGFSKEITVEDGVYIGSGATVLAGVTICQGAVIAAGAVVTKDCQPHGLYAGVPARRIRELATRD